MTGRPRRLRLTSLALVCLLSAAFSMPARAQDAPKNAGTDVPAPKRAKTVLPEYPPEAQAQGIRGIVILEVVIDTEGHVASAEVVRSIAALDEAALTAVRKWQYEVTKVDGKPVSVRLTVPITFALKVPEVTRQDGIPELRQGASPGFPPEGSRGKGGATVTAEVTLDATGAVADALVTAGEPPWDEALLRALRTWKFAVDDADSTIAFKVEAEFVAGSKGEAGHVNLRLSSPRKSKTATASADAPAPEPQEPAAPAPATPPPAASPTPAAPSVGAPPAAPAPVAAPPAATATPPAPAAAPAPVPAPAPGAAAEPPKPPVPAPKAAQPPVEMLTAPPQRQDTPAAPVENGVSAIREIALSPGVPDLVRGRRPVPPPLARMAGAVGSVQVRFSVNAAGGTTVVGADGPEIFRPAAEEAVASWSFRRASAERLHLVASFDYQLDKASATVHVEERQP